MRPLLQYVPARGPTIDLSSDDVFLLSLAGTGIAEPRHQAVRTPLRDGESIVRTLLEPRYVRAIVGVAPGSWTAFHDFRRTLAVALNPKLGMGTLRYQPVEGGALYEAGAYYEAGAGFGDVEAVTEKIALSFRCPDPAWRVSPAQSVSLTVEAGGLLIPLTIPLVIGTTAGQSLVHNTGDLVSYPLITFTAGAGGAESPAFTNVTTGKTLDFGNNGGLSLGSFESLVIDMSRGTATLAGANVLGFRTDESETWGLEPGINTLRVELDSGDGSTVVEFNRLLIGV